MLARNFASLEPSVINSRDGKVAESSQAEVSEDQESKVSARRIDTGAVKQNDIERLITRESSTISWDVLLDSSPECTTPSDERICSDNLRSHFMDS